MSARWITYEQARDYLGVPDATLDRYIDAGLIPSRGRGKGYRLDAAHTHAVGVLLQTLDGLLKFEGVEKPPPS